MRIADRIRAYRYIQQGLPIITDGFTSVWDTTKTSAGSSASNQVKLPLLSSGTYNFIVNWGDGSQDAITSWNSAKATHTYSGTGIYTVIISGVINGWQFNNTGDKLKLKEISKFDTLNIKDNAAFYGCSNLIITASDTFGTIGLTDTSNMFYSCSSLTTVPLFDLSSVTNANSMFRSCTSLTTVPLFDLSSLTNTGSMFQSCTSLTTVPLFNLSSVTNASYMFKLCTSLTTVPLFDLSSVTNASNIFNSCSSLTTVPLFDLSSVTNASNMFYSCSSLTTVPLFDLSSVTNVSNMFLFCTLSTTSYSDFLNHLNTLSLQSGVSFHGGNSKYNAGAATARANIISTYGWTITDGGAA